MVLLFLAEGFEELEALAPIDILRRAGCEVRTVGLSGRLVRGAHGITVEADLTEETLSALSETDPAVELVVLPGGPGTSRLEASDTVRRYVTAAFEGGRYIAAICAAPSVLGHWGLLKGHTAACYPGYEQALGCPLSEEPVVQSGNIITARGAGVAVEFGLKLTEALCGREKAETVRRSIQCR